MTTSGPTAEQSPTLPPTQTSDLPDAQGMTEPGELGRSLRMRSPADFQGNVHIAVDRDSQTRRKLSPQKTTSQKGIALIRVK